MSKIRHSLTEDSSLHLNPKFPIIYPGTVIPDFSARGSSHSVDSCKNFVDLNEVAPHVSKYTVLQNSCLVLIFHWRSNLPPQKPQSKKSSLDSPIEYSFIGQNFTHPSSCNLIRTLYHCSNTSLVQYWNPLVINANIPYAFLIVAPPAH